MKNTKEIINCYLECTKLRKIERYGIWPKRFRNNDAEHCLHLIYLADKLIEYYNFNLDFRKVVRYIYLHDWGEIGMKNDICAPDKMKSRAVAKATERINAHGSFNRLGLLNDINDYDDYNNLANDEAKFVTAIDKLESGLFFLSNNLNKVIKSAEKNGEFKHVTFASRADVINFETNYPKRAIEFFPPLKDFAEALMVELKKQVGFIKSKSFQGDI